MPSIEWNRSHWTASLEIHRQDTTADTAYGDQWGTIESYPPLQTVRDAWLLPFVGPDKTVLEVGTGGGRWTQFLLGAGQVYSVDVNPAMLEYAARRFSPPGNLHLIHTDGASVPSVPEASVDFVFSFGTLVHIDPPQISADLDAFRPLPRPLPRPGADLVLQYADKTKPTAAQNIHFAHTDALMMETLLWEQGYRVIRHETDLIHHSNLVHFRAMATADRSAELWPLATRTPTRILAWPDYRSPEELTLLFRAYGAALVNQPDTCLCLRRDPQTDLPAEAVQQILEAAFSLHVKDGSLDILVIDDPLGPADWPRLGAAVTGCLDLPSAAWGRRAAFLSSVEVPRARSTAHLLRALPS